MYFPSIIRFMINFKPIHEIDKTLYENYLFAEAGRGCELSYANLCLWGDNKAAIVDEHLVLLSKYKEKYLYPFPMGKGDVSKVLEAIFADAAERGLPCILSSLTPEHADYLNEHYPDRFDIRFNRDSFDYVYAIDKLADLKGRKYHRKRNHYNRFCKEHPDFHVAPLSAENEVQVNAFIQEWYRKRLEESPENNYHSEQQALERCSKEYAALGMESLVLYDKEEILAFTMASHLSDNTFDVHFEKARWDVEGAYTAINCEFAKYLRDKYPEIEFLDREEDMGLEGLRKAKESYFPHHMIEKGIALPKEIIHEH